MLIRLSLFLVVIVLITTNASITILYSLSYFFSTVSLESKLQNQLKYLKNSLLLREGEGEETLGIGGSCPFFGHEDTLDWYPVDDCRRALLNQLPSGASGNQGQAIQSRGHSLKSHAP